MTEHTFTGSEFNEFKMIGKWEFRNVYQDPDSMKYFVVESLHVDEPYYNMKEVEPAKIGVVEWKMTR